MRLINYAGLKTEKGIRYSRDHLRVKCRKGEFPRPLHLSAQRIAWNEAEVDAWIAERAAERDQTGT